MPGTWLDVQCLLNKYSNNKGLPIGASLREGLGGWSFVVTSFQGQMPATPEAGCISQDILAVAASKGLFPSGWIGREAQEISRFKRRHGDRASAKQFL